MTTRLEQFLIQSEQKVDPAKVSLNDELVIGDLGTLAADIVIAGLRRYRFEKRQVFYEWYISKGHEEAKSKLQREVSELQRSINGLQKRHKELLKSDPADVNELERNVGQIRAIESEISAAVTDIKQKRDELETFDDKLEEGKTRLDYIKGQIALMPPSVFRLEIENGRG